MENNYNDDNNMIVELNNTPEDTLFDDNIVEETTTMDDEIKVVKKKNKLKKEFFWKKLSKKGKIIIILIVFFIIAIIAGLLIYFLIIKKDKPVEKTPDIVIEKDSYIYDNGNLKFLDNKNNVIGTYKCIDESAEKCYIASFTNEDTFDTPKYLDSEGNVINKTSKIYNERYVFVHDEGKITLYDISKDKKDGEYELIKNGEIDKDIIIAKEKNGKYGLIVFEGDNYGIKLDFKYDYLGIATSDTKFVVKDNNTSYLVDINGKSLSPKISGDIKSFDDNYIAVSNDDYVLYDYNGKKVLEDDFDYLEFLNGYVITIKNTKMFIYDKSLFKLNEKGIKIKSSNYQKEYIFDEKNNLSDTKKAYNISITSNLITVEIIESKEKTTTKEINLAEANLSKNTSYVSYLDGILYIYNDEAKKNLIGSYSCNNKNTIKSVNESFTNCFIAKDTNIANKIENLGYTPIFNENYAFINDTKEGATSNTIVLYDLKAGSIKAKYQEVDTGISSENISFVSGTNGLIYAKNTSGNLGVITFGNNGPEGLIAFQEDGNGTSKIAFLDDYLLVTRGSKQYLYTKLGKLLATSNFTIKEYANNYLVVKDKGYLVYNMASSVSGTIISNELDYIKLYNNFFIGIKDKKLNIYLLNDGKNPLLEEAINIKTNSLESSYKIDINIDGYVISIVESDNSMTEYKFNKDWSIIE